MIFYFFHQIIQANELNEHSYTEMYRICKILKIDLLGFQGFKSFDFSKSRRFKYK
jgi:hypothetical protein